MVFMNGGTLLGPHGAMCSPRITRVALPKLTPCHRQARRAIPFTVGKTLMHTGPGYPSLVIPKKLTMFAGVRLFNKTAISANSIPILWPKLHMILKQFSI